MSTHEISVEVGFDHILDPKALGFGLFDVLIHIALWIHDSRFALRTDQVRRVGQTAQVELFEVHNVSP
jgi:hypothetical protein